MDQIYDVFLSYHWRDRETVERIARSLRDQGLTPFLDRWYLIPGRPWPQALEEVLASCRAVSVCIGPGEMGPWQQRELYFALDRQGRKADFSVVPVLLPGSDPVLGFLGQNTWVDLRQGTDDPLLLSLFAGAIRGEAPGPDLAQRIRVTRATLCPYRGLLYFREEDAPFLFGREAAIRNLHEAVRQHQFIAIVGASGSGKSSVLRAGLVPQLRQEKATTWEIATLFPGDEPLKALARALSPLLEPEIMDETDRLRRINNLADAFTKKEVSLHDVGLRILEKQSGTNQLLLAIDQAEELYTVTKDDQKCRRFIEEILEASERGSWTAILALRGDFVGKALSYRPLSDRLQGAQVNLGPMTRDELEQAITCPARRVELSFAPGLVRRILDDVGDEPGHLPLLEFVLKRLWEDRQGPELSHQAYEAMGGLHGAVANKAEEVFGKLTLLEQEAVKRVFLQVVRAGETGEDTRRRAALSEIGQGAMDVVKRLADERLLVTNRAEAGEDTVEVSHEALIRHWQRLQDWLNEDREFLLWRERLRGRVTEWQLNKKDEGTLLRGALLVEAQRWLSQKVDILTDEEKEYIRHSAEAHERAVQEERQRAEHELAQAKRLAEEASKREEAERARAAAAEQARKAADRARRRQRYLSLALLIFFVGAWVSTWLWQKGYSLDQATMKMKSLFVSIYVEPEIQFIPGGKSEQDSTRSAQTSEGDYIESHYQIGTIQPFAIGKFEVTFDEYDVFALAADRVFPSDQGWGRGRRPVINVSWQDAKDYAEWLSRQTGKPYRLPRQSEWEYAARSGGKAEFWAGTSDPHQVPAYAVYADNSEARTAPVGRKIPNGLGLYDMSGNVWEWVEDCINTKFGKAPTADVFADPNLGKADLADSEASLQLTKCQLRVIRGGSWGENINDLRASLQYWDHPSNRSGGVGFRLVQDVPQG
jgi:formylglycine-generating enzyme required for sulfatase activity